jgi:hypothetical protein
MKCAHCGHTHTDADGRMNIDRCAQCAWANRHARRHGEMEESVCTDFDH